MVVALKNVSESKTGRGVNICHQGTNVHQSAVLQIIYDGGSGRLGFSSFFFLTHPIYVSLPVFDHS